MNMKNQQGLVSYFIFIGGAILIVLGLLFLSFTLTKNNTSKNPPVVSSQAPEITCDSRDYGGCDEEKNFYKWEDDGKP